MSYPNGFIRSNNVNDIADFSSAMDDLITSKFILAEKRISTVLQTIAGNPALYDLFRQALVGYNYAVEFSKSRSSERGRPKLVLPQNQARKIAYVFCLLMEIDTGKRSLKNFLDEYFFLPRPNQSFTLFASDMLEPFKEITEYLYVNGISSLVDEEEIGYSLRREANEILSGIKEIISRTQMVGTDTKRDLFIILAGIENAITPNKADLVKALLIGFNYTVAQSQIYDLVHDHVVALKALLSDADVI